MLNVLRPSVWVAAKVLHSGDGDLVCRQWSVGSCRQRCSEGSSSLFSCTPSGGLFCARMENSHSNKLLGRLARQAESHTSTSNKYSTDEKNNKSSCM